MRPSGIPGILRTLVRTVRSVPRLDARAYFFALCVCVVVLLLLGGGGGREAYEDASAETIFVSVAAYRDADCINTVKNIFEQADHPERIRVGLCEQITDDLSEVCTPQKFTWHNNVRRIQIPHGEAKGPTMARYLCASLYRGEAYFMQIDSHTRFKRGWDSKSVAMLKACPSKKPILSHYPHDLEYLDKPDDEGVPVLCKSSFNADGVPQLEAVIKDAGKNRPVPYVSGGFIFGIGSMVTDVPYDPTLDHLFQGEEILHAARLWTHGYDMFSPAENVAFHYYGRDDHPKFWDLPDTSKAQKVTLERVHRLLGLKGPPLQEYKWGMGTARTLEAYWAFAGIDPAKKTSASEQKFCV